MIRILLVDDQPLIRSGIAMLLSAERNMDVVGEASDGAEAIEQARRLLPDVVVMDVRMPGVDGATATGTITAEGFVPAECRSIKVIMLSTFNVDQSVHLALRAGASGFVLKDAVPGELVAAINAVAAGRGWLDPAVTAGLIAEFAARPNNDVPTPAELDQLTPREREVLILIAHGMSNHDIARHLVVSIGTVKTHVGRILMKLGLRDRARAVTAAYQTGLVLPRTSPPSSWRARDTRA